MFAAPAALAFLYYFRREEGDGFALRAVDVMGQAAVVTGIDGMAEQAADYHGKDERKHKRQIREMSRKVKWAMMPAHRPATAWALMALEMTLR